MRRKYAEIYDWEFDLICTRQKHDVKLWKSIAAKIGGPVLDLCCGSGRLTKELAKLNLEITALDNDSDMLNLLKKKNLNKVKTVLADMRNFQIDELFKLVIISYSSFQQLLEEEEQIQCLMNIGKHLEKGGLLGIDINPHLLEGKDSVKNEIAYIADFLPGNSRITMFTSYHTDKTKQIRFWQDRYVEIDNQGMRTEFINEIALKHCPPKMMKRLFSVCGYEILDVYGDFDGGSVTEHSWNEVWLVRKK